MSQFENFSQITPNAINFLTISSNYTDKQKNLYEEIETLKQQLQTLKKEYNKYCDIQANLEIQKLKGIGFGSLICDLTTEKYYCVTNLTPVEINFIGDRYEEV